MGWKAPDTPVRNGGTDGPFVLAAERRRVWLVGNFVLFDLELTDDQ
jgi:hypothetical protein